MPKRKTPQIPKEIHFIDDPRGPTYNRLIDFALKQCTKFSLVWREDLGNKKRENDIANKLAPFLLSDTTTNKWPGTEIFSGSANVCFYKLTPETANVLKTAKRLYQWEAPDFPEDLAFYAKTGEIWLGSVAHEHMGWINTASTAVLELESMLSFLFKNGVINKKYV
jgi:hypothetical protein